MAPTNAMSHGQSNGNNNDEEDYEDLIDSSLLAKLNPEERAEAIAAAAAARRAEQRAEERAIARALDERRRQREDLQKKQAEKVREWQEKSSNDESNVKKRKVDADGGTDDAVGSGSSNGAGGTTVKFLSRRQREAMARAKTESKSEKDASASSKPAAKKVRSDKTRNAARPAAEAAASAPSHLTPEEMMEIKRTYLGANAATALLVNPDEERRKQLAAKKKKRAAKKITFKFEWDAADDTSASVDPLYDQTLKRTTTANGARRSGQDLRTDGSRRSRNDDVATVASVTTKPITQMTTRDWRIFRENYDIRVRGGKAPPPLRTFRETPVGVVPIHPSILDAVEHTLRYREPSAIQRQAIPIGLQRRDLIGIAETGSGKTAAFGIPLCHYILSLPHEILRTVEDEGPLALVMAPTRELALQIDVEFAKLLSRQTEVKTLAVVGGQSIQSQAYKLRQGVHVVVGTPGRINDCVETAYLVLNQCSYIVLDEADRMIDLGFAPQIEQILESMGGSLKSEDESLAYQQEQDDLERLGKAVPRHRLTAMFSATMPSEVERIAKRYLRHPAVVSIGDRDSVKNARIVQRVLFLSSPKQKENALRDILVRSRPEEKIIVFVNEKKHAEGVSRMVENSGKRSVVLHGGKTQDQREENLEAFRRGGVVLVATDVAGRGLDIPNVSHIINFDLPSRSIDNYCHRIGRTGRAGKEGLATSFITDADEGIMAPLRQYLESTNSQVPDRLARHPAAVSGVPGGNLTL